jgi:hypothetical protein
MTIAAGIDFRAYVLLAADTRTTYYPNIGGMVYKAYEDDSVKIQKIDSGLITGAGCVELLEPVKDRLNEETISNSDQIFNIIQEERARFQESWVEFGEQCVDMTGWIFSYRTAENEAFKLRLCIVHPAIGNGNVIAYVRKENEPFIIAPVEANEKQVGIMTDFLKKSIRPIEQFENLHDSIDYHGLLFAELVRGIQPAFASVSSCCQIGVHTLDGRTGISAIMKDTDTRVPVSLTRSKL